MLPLENKDIKLLLNDFCIGIVIGLIIAVLA